ncbi:aldose epimerase family protein [Dyella sp. A6]|uniref:aldose epimerase family protein n=1 Tax=Dyella aluminiiresistens TaxID=3069105 RepID=UPI002E7704D4|nr:aldose epimerase family protein [Dyella sp. A6]
MQMYRRILGVSLAGVLLMPALALAATAQKSLFGTLPDGRAVDAVTLDNGHGIRVRVITFGARVQSIVTPDRNGHPADIALGYGSLEGYLGKRQFFGATVGRFANRIAKGRFTLDGKTYQLPTNDGPNSLHGGTKGFDMQLWKILSIKQGKAASVSMRYVSPDGDQGYPGTLTVTATYTLYPDDRLTIDYQATTDKPTIVNISNHTYWNLNGEGSGTVFNQRMMIPAAQITPVDATQIPTGAFRDVAGTPFDFRKAKPIGADIHDGHSRQLLIGLGYDMNWVISRQASAKPRLVARIVSPSSGRVLSLYSRKPGLQFYSGNFLNGSTVGISGHTYRQGDAFVLEPQLFPDTPNHPNFGSARLNPGQVYRNRITYRFSTVGAGR